MVHKTRAGNKAAPAGHADSLRLSVAVFLVVHVD